MTQIGAGTHRVASMGGARIKVLELATKAAENGQPVSINDPGRYVDGTLVVEIGQKNAEQTDAR